MTDIEQKALALVNDCGGKHTYLKREWNPRYEALCRAIEQHEAFRQEVSDALLRYHAPTHVPHGLQDLIIPAPKPDPLLAAMNEVIKTADVVQANADQLRTALDALGFEIREKNDD